jgi:hypothetical protein
MLCCFPKNPGKLLSRFDYLFLKKVSAPGIIVIYNCFNITTIINTQGDALSLLLYNFALDYAIKKVQETQVALKLNGTHQLLAYADDVNLLGDNIDTIKKNTEILIDASKEVWSRNKCR